MTKNKQNEVKVSNQDLMIALQAIDIGIAKGAYPPHDIETIGTIRNKIAKFLANEQKKEPQLLTEDDND